MTKHLIDLLEDKPEWYKGYAMALSAYIIESARVSTGSWGRSERSPVSVHMDECAVSMLHDLEDSVYAGTNSDSYGDEYAEAEVTLSVRFSCICGEYMNVPLSCSGTVGDALGYIL